MNTLRELKELREFLRNPSIKPDKVCALCARHSSQHPDLLFAPSPVIRVLGRQVWFCESCSDDLLNASIAQLLTRGV